jgi:protein-disulfide isomerase
MYTALNWQSLSTDFCAIREYLQDPDILTKNYSIMKKPVQTIAWIAFIGVVIAALAWGIFGNKSSNNTTQPRGEAQVVTILKYSDYQCPACKFYIPFQKQLKEEFGDLVQLEYRHFPLGTFPYSMDASRSVEAARMQGKFYEMHDMIFENQEVWSRGNGPQIFRGYAEELGLDMEQFEADYNSEEVETIIRNHRAEGERRGVRGTPVYFINGTRLFQNPQNYNQFKSVVELYMYRSS